MRKGNMVTSRYDVFISHNRQDKPSVRQICRNLRSAGLRVFFDEDSIPPGADIVSSIERALDASRHVLLFLSKASLSSKWVALEIAISVFGDPDASNRVLIPVALEKLNRRKIRASLRRLKIIELFGDGAHCITEYGRILKCLGVDASIAKKMKWGSEAVAVNDVARPPRIVHDLPPAPRFVGRTKEIARLEDFWKSDAPGVLSLVGIGGSGKTALLVEFLRIIDTTAMRPRAMFVWSFYDQADPNAFLSAVYEYFTGRPKPEIKGLSWILMLKEVLSYGSRNLLILDGLEKVQRVERTQPGDRHVFGEIEDTLLRDVLRRLASGAGTTKAILTTRFPVVDLGQWSERGAWVLNLDELDTKSSLSLLRRHGVQGSDSELRLLVDKYGRHALTLDHLGSMLSRFFAGDIAYAPDLEPVGIRGRGAQAHRLRRILEAYERCIQDDEKAVLTSLCIFTYPVSVEILVKSFLQSPKKKIRIVPNFPQDHITLRECLDSLIQLHLVLRDRRGNLTVHPAIRDHFYQLNPRRRSLHKAASKHLMTLAGRPGAHLPVEPERLQLLENLVEHLILSDNKAGAEKIYFHRLGGMYHLSWMGEHVRGLRILKLFPTIIDYDGYLRFRRGVGDIPSSWEWKTYESKLSWYSTHGRESAMLLLGRLKDSGNTAASYLRGEDVRVCYSDDYAPRFQALLLFSVGNSCAHNCFNPETAIEEILGNNDFKDEDCDKVQQDEYEDLGANGSIKALWFSETNRLAGNFHIASMALEAASHWILRTSSAEHLLAYHLARGRLCTDMGRLSEARRTLSEAILLADQFSMAVFHVDLLIELSRLDLIMEDIESAKDHAAQAAKIASKAAMRYVWALRASELITLASRDRSGDGKDEILRDTKVWRKLVGKLPNPSAMVIYLGELFRQYSARLAK